jgi:hypothetical protein
VSGPAFVRVTARLQVGLRCGAVVRMSDLPDLDDLEFGGLDEDHSLVKSGDLILNDVGVCGYDVDITHESEDSLEQTDVTATIEFDLLVHPDHVGKVVRDVRGQADGAPDEGGDEFGPLVFDLYLNDGLHEWSVFDGPRVLQVLREGVAL